MDKTIDDTKLLRETVQTLKEMKEVQCRDGNWNCDSYMHGMANGLIFALSLFEGGGPVYLQAPKVWKKDGVREVLRKVKCQGSVRREGLQG